MFIQDWPSTWAHLTRSEPALLHFLSLALKHQFYGLIVGWDLNFTKGLFHNVLWRFIFSIRCHTGTVRSFRLIVQLTKNLSVKLAMGSKAILRSSSWCWVVRTRRSTTSCWCSVMFNYVKEIFHFFFSFILNLLYYDQMLWFFLVYRQPFHYVFTDIVLFLKL